MDVRLADDARAVPQVAQDAARRLRHGGSAPSIFGSPSPRLAFNTTASRCVRQAAAAGVVGSGSLGLAVIAGAGSATRAIMSDLGVSRSVIAAQIRDRRLG